MRLSHTLLILLLISSIENPASSIEYRTYQFELTRELTDHKDPVYSVIFNPDGSIIASGSADKSAKLWNADSGKQIRALMRHPYPILCVAFSPDSNILASGSEAGNITFWDINYKERIRTLKEHEERVQSIRFSPDGASLASGSADKTIRLWDMRSGKQIRIFAGHTGSVNSISFSPNGEMLASGSADGTVKLWDVSSGEFISTLKGAGGAVNSISFAPDGNTLASGSEDGTIRLWDVSSKKESKVLTGHEKAIGINDCLAFSPDGRLLASGSADAKILIWNAASGNIISELKAHKTAVDSIAFSPDSRSMLSAGLDGVIRQWKILVIESLEITLDAEYEGWQRGIIALKAELLGVADVVKFQYSLDNSIWLDIAEKTEPPYSVNWNTASSIPGIGRTVYVRAVAERVTGTRSMDISDRNFAVDNEPPKSQHDYDGLWHKADFDINLSADDGDGAGLKAIRYRLNYGTEQNVRWNEQPRITEEGVNTLEFWSVDELGNEEQHNILSEVKLDKTGPAFFNWTKEPAILPEGFQGPFRVSVRVMDEKGSGIEGKTPQFGYHIGPDTNYDGYKDMSQGDGGVWYYDISEPSGGWDSYRDKSVYYKAKCEDVAGNVGESPEQQELVGSSMSPPVVKMTGALREWEGGKLSLEAEASDADGIIKNVSFEYSLNNYTWKLIGESSEPPYSVEWDTTSDISEIEETVWVQVTAFDDDGLSAKYVTSSFSIDNEKPTTRHDYDGDWHRESFNVNLTADDGQGSGIASIKYKINNGSAKDVSANGQPEISKQGTNTLEYWSVDMAGTEGEHETLSDLKLDRMPPVFGNWQAKRDGDILHIQVDITDDDSGIGTAAQFDHHIGSGTGFSGYREMRKIEDNSWGYDLDISDRLPGAIGKTLFCKFSAKDVVGNLGIGTWEYGIAGEFVTATDTTPGTETVTEPERKEDFDIKTIPAEKTVERTEVTPSGDREKSSIAWRVQDLQAVDAGQEVSVQGRLEPRMGKSLPVELTVIAPDNTIYKSRMDTSPNGDFEFNVSLTSGGEWKVFAEWQGDSKYEPAKSDILSLRAIPQEGDEADEPGAPSPAVEKAQKAGTFVKRNTVIIGIVFLYILIVRLYRS